MRLFFKYLSKQRMLVVFVLLLAILDQVAINLIPYLFGKVIIDPYGSRIEYFKSAGRFNELKEGILNGILLMIGTSIIALIANTFRNYYLNIGIQKFSTQLFNDVQEKILSLKYEEYEQEISGEILSNLQRARNDCEKFINKFMNVLLSTFVAFGVLTVVTISINIWLPIIFIVSAFLLSYITRILTARMRIIQKKIVQDSNFLAGYFNESLRNIHLIKCLGLAQQETERVRKKNQMILNTEDKKLKKIRSISAIFGTVVITINQGMIAMLLLFLLYDKLSIGELIMMQIYFFSIFNTLGDLGSVMITYRDAEASLNEIERLTNKPSEKSDHPRSQIANLNKVNFENVSFRHRNSSKLTLSNINLSVAIGESIAIVGASGAGKSTLVKMLLGLYFPTKGEIFYNNCSIKQVDFEHLRQCVGVVPQEAQLFSGSILENMLFVNPMATSEQILQALHEASCDSLISRLPQGINTQIGENGARLSGGERQRLSIARSILRNSKLLIFDEPTSSLDTITEGEILQTIRIICENRRHIVIIISHRLSVVMNVDRIYVLNEGIVVEEGSHANLTSFSGIYNKMWLHQTSYN